jgi:hypothetical protein
MKAWRGARPAASGVQNFRKNGGQNFRNRQPWRTIGGHGPTIGLVWRYIVLPWRTIHGHGRTIALPWRNVGEGWRKVGEGWRNVGQFRPVIGGPRPNVEVRARNGGAQGCVGARPRANTVT